MKVFPASLFSPNGNEPYLDRRVISGGVSLSEDETLIGTDGGGRVVVEFSDFDLDDTEVARAWDAIDAYMDGGLRAIIVPLCDTPHQPAFSYEAVAHGDGSSFSDESLYSTPGSDVSLAADAGLRATSIEIDIAALNGIPMGWFSINHPTWRHRCYKVAEIISQTDTSATISIRPPLREAATAGTAIDFATPRCTMRIDGEMRAPRTMGYAEGGDLRFVEDMTGSYS
ncbi:hypothetical protein [Novosphingobium sp. MBES04]|uniref:hypothetical protein n=1 Tax=Novosphingobium sp. MBES04 TaxID=1206458 RepID=UPI00057D27C6|nr:hypothetical protein [Novosphingobium sp. MBES04]GAM06319.1 hypothetical conserved protein [Novosphingobium sp. MBES04]